MNLQRVPPAATKVVFLDIDGVLNNHITSGLRPLSNALDLSRVALLEQLCAATGAAVVISSSWRLMFSPQEIGQMLAAKGLTAPVIDGTPCFLPSRADEIKAWLAAHPEVTGYVILDDDETACIPGHFIKTTLRHGLEAHHVPRARYILEEAEQGGAAR